MKNGRRYLLSALGKLLADDNLVVIRNEGGLASQIAFWALGHELAQRGYSVKFDNSWFKSHGLDINGQFSRNFDFQKAFPNLLLDEVSRIERFILKKSNNFREGDLNQIVTPVYLGGFYDGTDFDRWNLVQKYQGYLTQHFEVDKSLFSDKDKKILSQIEKDDHSCGVHVRRGDLASDNLFYGKSLTAEYFSQAVDVIRSGNENSFFYFFSDEPEWVKENVAKNLGADIPHLVIDENGSDRGYVDLYLLSQCRTFISSQGGFAKFARLLGDPSRLIIEPSSRAIFDESDENVIVLQV